jgi:type I restriction enzyme M protein
VRQKLIETGDVDVMIAVRSNFFYTRTVPCELWFLNRDRAEEHRGQVLMIDARSIYRKVTRKIYDFSPEQEQNLLAIVRLYRGETERYLDLVSSYCRRTLDEAKACFMAEDENCSPIQPLPQFAAALHPFLETVPKDAANTDLQKEMVDAWAAFQADALAFQKDLAAQQAAWKTQKITNGELKKAVDRLAPLAEASRNLVKQTDLLYKLIGRLIESRESLGDAGSRDACGSREGTRARKAADEARLRAAQPLKQVRYFWKQARWLTERFPEAKLRDVEGLVKLASIEEIAANDWSLTPGRYVGVVPEEEDEGFDFEETLREIHVELEDLNAEAALLAETIKRNFEVLGA